MWKGIGNQVSERCYLSCVLTESSKPARLAHILFFELAQASGKNSRSSQIANDPALVGAIDHRKPSDVVTQHLFGGLMQGLIGESDDHVSRSRLEQGH